MFQWESRRTRRSGRKGRRPDVTARVENLEDRQLLAYSPIGIPLPDLTVTGYAASVASWGGTLAITANVDNTSASSIIQPLSLEPGATSTADAPASQLGVYISRSPRNLNNAIEIGRLDVPIVTQNSLQVVQGTVTLPNRPTGYPGDGGKIYVFLRANDANQFLESDSTNNNTAPFSLKIEAPLPELSVVGFDVPPVISPGDTIQANVRVANLGTADTASQGNVQVSLVASTTPYFNSGSKIVASAYVSNIPAQASVASQGTVLGDANQTPGSNIVTIAFDPATLSKTPAKYYLGVVIDPNHQIKQIQTVPQGRKTATTLSLPHQVGPNTSGLTPAGVVYSGGVANVPVFPYSQTGFAVGASPDGTFPPSIYGTSSLSSSSVSSTSSSGTSTSVTSTANGSTSTTVGGGINGSSRGSITTLTSSATTATTKKSLANRIAASALRGFGLSNISTTSSSNVAKDV